MNFVSVFQIPYARSEEYLQETLEKVCDHSSEWAFSQTDDQKTIIFVRKKDAKNSIINYRNQLTDLDRETQAKVKDIVSAYSI